MPDSSGHIEKRAFERVDLRIAVNYKVIQEAEMERLISTKAYQDISLGQAQNQKIKDVMTVVTENISVGGLMIVGNEPFTIGSSIQMEMQLPQTPLPLKCLAVIVRSSESPVNGKYSAGVRFLGINKDDTAKIQRYIVLLKRADIQSRS